MSDAAGPSPRLSPWGPALLMATSAIGPGFLTQTALFTSRHGASFGFAILASTVLDVIAQVSIWRLLVASGRRAPDLANAVLPGLGTLVTVLVVLGGLAFNIGNVAGAGLGLQVLTGLPPATGAALSGAVAVALFLAPDAGRAMDRAALALGALMIGLTAWAAIVAQPPLAEAALRAVAPTQLPALAILTLVGGTVGGYIPYAGGHRLLEQGARGTDGVALGTRAALLGLGAATAMRVALFLAAYGVVASDRLIDLENPPASVFRTLLGGGGAFAFGIVMWSAAITSVVGSAYTSVSFLRSLVPAVDRRPAAAIVAFIAASALVFVVVGQPVRLLVLAGALNGLVLPLSLGAMLLATFRPALLGGYRHPAWLTVLGALVVLVMGGLGVWTLVWQVASQLVRR
ncbi:MAG: NRAMP family divalent metal transporter [Gemmatimonadales bacterium]|nr:NRAMP family divalent metal transporter [Gemmatimonadales bacterium]